ncbi:MAG: hypothetical protein VKL41_08280 [Snowella sp.]|nr:hypothetical protein [Snowella sp.]
MKQIILISCSSKKLNIKSRAEDLYSSTLFKKSLKYAKHLNPDNIYILSALHGLVDLKQEIEPYDITLKNLPYIKRVEWGKNVLEMIKKIADIDKDLFVFLAGQEYINPLCESIKNLESPLQGLRIGERIKLLNKI